MDNIGRPARVETRLVRIELRVPVAEAEGWEGLSEDQIDARMARIGSVAAYSAGIIEALCINPEYCEWAHDVMRTAASMVSEMYRRD